MWKKIGWAVLTVVAVLTAMLAWLWSLLDTEQAAVDWSGTTAAQIGYLQPMLAAQQQPGYQARGKVLAVVTSTDRARQILLGVAGEWLCS